MTKPPLLFDWVREIKPDLKKIDSIPLTGAVLPFPWEEFSSQLARTFDCEGLMFQPGEISWRAGKDLYEGLGDSPISQSFSIPPLPGTICWIMPSQEMDILAALLLSKDTQPLLLHDQDLAESFYRFFTLEILHHLTQCPPFDKTLTPLLINQSTQPDQDSLCWDITLRLKGHAILGRLVIPPDFRHHWVEHFAQQPVQTALSQQMLQLIDVIVHVEAGKTHLTLNEWKQVQAGDFILVDNCSLDPTKLDGRVMLSIYGKQAFRAKLKNGTLKILELPLSHEVDTPMTNHKEDEDDLNDLDLPEENSEGFEEDEDLFGEDDLFTEEEETEATTETETPLEEPSEPPLPKASAPSSSAQPISPEEIPLALTVEIGQIQMTMDQLLKLEPGNLLEIEIHPENGVDLTINGKLVGKGELIRIGEALGVRVLQIGRT